MSQHTPGPWTVTLKDGSVWDGYPIKSNGKLVALARAAGGPTREAKANARLIAKAPEMYDALQFAADLLKHLSEMDGTVTGWKKGGKGDKTRQTIRALLREIEEE